MVVAGRDDMGAAFCTGSTVCLVLARQHGGGVTFDNVLPDYKRTLGDHTTSSTHYPVETMVQTAFNPVFEMPSPPHSIGCQASLYRPFRSYVCTYMTSLNVTHCDLGAHAQYWRNFCRIFARMVVHVQTCSDLALHISD